MIGFNKIINKRYTFAHELLEAVEQYLESRHICNFVNHVHKWEPQKDRMHDITDNIYVTYQNNEAFHYSNLSVGYRDAVRNKKDYNDKKRVFDADDANSEYYHLAKIFNIQESTCNSLNSLIDSDRYVSDNYMLYSYLLNGCSSADVPPIALEDIMLKQYCFSPQTIARDILSVIKRNIEGSYQSKTFGISIMHTKAMGSTLSRCSKSFSEQVLDYKDCNKLERWRSFYNSADGSSSETISTFKLASRSMADINTTIANLSVKEVKSITGAKGKSYINDLLDSEFTVADDVYNMNMSAMSATCNPSGKTYGLNSIPHEFKLSANRTIASLLVLGGMLYTKLMALHYDKQALVLILSPELFSLLPVIDDFISEDADYDDIKAYLTQVTDGVVKLMTENVINSVKSIFINPPVSFTDRASYEAINERYSGKVTMDDYVLEDYVSGGSSVTSYSHSTLISYNGHLFNKLIFEEVKLMIANGGRSKVLDTVSTDSDFHKYCVETYKNNPIYLKTLDVVDVQCMLSSSLKTQIQSVMSKVLTCETYDFIAVINLNSKKIITVINNHRESLLKMAVDTAKNVFERIYEVNADLSVNVIRVDSIDSETLLADGIAILRSAAISYLIDRKYKEIANGNQTIA